MIGGAQLYEAPAAQMLLSFISRWSIRRWREMRSFNLPSKTCSRKGKMLFEAPEMPGEALRAPD